MTADNPLWSIRVPVPAGAAKRIAAIEAALEPFAVALSSFELEGGPDWVVEALSEEEPDRAALRDALAAVGADGASATVAVLPERDWIAECQRHLPPLRAGRFFVHGSHVTDPAPEGSVALQIDPGLAFGTGHHETTRGCLLALDRLAGSGRRFSRPLDMGCGSGILALAAARLWGVEVLACDNDPKAVAVARENARINGLAERVRAVRSDGFAASAVRRRAPFDLIVSNILARPLCRMAGGLARVLAPDGVTILSGLLVDQEEAVLAAYRRQSIDIADRIRLGDWSVLILAPETKTRTAAPEGAAVAGVKNG